VWVWVSVSVSVSVWGAGDGRYICMYIHLYTGPGAYTLRRDLEQDYVDSLWKRVGGEKRAVIGDHWLPGAAPFDRQVLNIS
jgi:hypothetical protein